MYVIDVMLEGSDFSREIGRRLEETPGKNCTYLPRDLTFIDELDPRFRLPLGCDILVGEENGPALSRPSKSCR